MIQQTSRAMWVAVAVWAAALGVPTQAAVIPVSTPVVVGGDAPQWHAAAGKPQKKATRRKTKTLAEPERTPSGESVTTRERRLLRECKGRPNAGACLGYAS